MRLSTVTLRIGEVVEEHVQVVNPEDRHYVAVVVPLAAVWAAGACACGTATASDETKSETSTARSIRFLREDR